MSFFKQVGLTLLTKGGLLVITFVYNILLSRTLRAEGIGVIGSLATFANIGVQFGNLGLSIGAKYFIGLDRERSSAIAGTLTSTGLLISILLFAGFALLALINPGIIGSLDYSLYLIALITIAPLLLALHYQNLLLAFRKIAEYNWIELLVRFLSLIAAVIILVVFDRSLWIPAIVWLTVGYSVLLAILNGYYVRKTEPFRLSFDRTAFRDMIGYSWKSYYGSLLAFLIIRSDILFLNVWRSQAEMGIYRQVIYVTDLVYLIPMTLGVLLFPQLMQQGASQQTGLDERARFTMLVSRLTGLIMVAFWILFFFIGRWFLGIFGPEFPAGYQPLMILLGGMIFYGIQTVLAAELARRGMPIFVVVYSTLCLIVKVIGNVLLIPGYGTYGAAWSSLATHIVFFTMVIWYCVKYYGFTLNDTLIVKPNDFIMIAQRIKELFRK